MFVLGKVKAKDEYDLLVSPDHHSKSNVAARKYVAAADRVRKDDAVTSEQKVTAGLFDASSAGVTKQAKFLSTRGFPLALSSIKMLNAAALQRLPEGKQPPDLSDKVLSDEELVDVGIRKSLLTGVLDLKNRNMPTLPPRAMGTLLMQFGNITAINLNSNQLSTIPAGLAPLCPRLTELHVSKNRLRTVPRAILYLPRVTELNLSFNFIAEVDVIQAPEMTRLRFSHNHVHALDNLSYMKKLTHMHLDHCHLTTLSAHIKKLKHLTFLDLSYNTLVSLALPSREAMAARNAARDKESGKGKGKGKGKKGSAVKGVVASAAALGDNRTWNAVLDPYTKQVSYFCPETKEVRRTKPPGFDDQKRARQEKMAARRAALQAEAAEKGLVEHVPDYVLAAQKVEAAKAAAEAEEQARLKALEDAKTAATLPPATPTYLRKTLAAKLGSPGGGGDKASAGPSGSPLPPTSARSAAAQSVASSTASGMLALPDEPSSGSDDDDDTPVKLKGWELTVDTSGSDGLVYYTDLATGVTQWDMPREMDGLDYLENVTFLNISHNRLTAIAPGVFRMKSLTELNAEHNNIMTLPTNLYFATSLTHLNLSWNRLEDLPDQVTSMNWLQVLTVDNNCLTKLPLQIGRMQGLTKFWFGMNKIEELPFSFGSLPDSMDVMFFSNPFRFPSIKDVQRGLKQVLWTCRHEGLKYFRGPPPTLKIVETGIADEGNFYEADFTKQLNLKLKDSAESLKLDMNFQNLKKLPRYLVEAVWNATNLTDLRLVGNKFNKLNPQIYGFTCLKKLVLRGNVLTELPDCWDRMPSMTSFNVENNQLTELPPSLVSMTKLKELSVSNNRLFALPHGFTRLTALKMLIVESNYLRQLPDNLGHLHRLQYFSAARNRIKFLPQSVVGLTRLRSLVLYQNRLGDRGLPDSVCDMSNLRELRLSHNYISRLPYRFSSAPIMKSLRVLWLYANQFFDIGDLALRLGSIKDFRIDINPMVNPPPRYTTGQLASLVDYTAVRIFRIRDIQRRCEAEGWTVDPTRLVPVACRDGHFIVEHGGMCLEDELKRVDAFVEKYVNGDIETFTESPKPMIDQIVAAHHLRRFKHIRMVVMEFQKLLHFLFWNDFISDEYFCTSLVKPWGRHGEDVECYGLDLDALYVNTGFRVAVLDFVRGPDRLKQPKVCRFADPEEFQPKNAKGMFKWFSKKKKERAEDAGVRAKRERARRRLDDDPEEEIEKMKHIRTVRNKAGKDVSATGNWLWQLVTELVPDTNDRTDVLNDQFPPPCNRLRNPDCHPLSTDDAERRGRKPPSVPLSVSVERGLVRGRGGRGGDSSGEEDEEEEEEEDEEDDLGGVEETKSGGGGGGGGRRTGDYTETETETETDGAGAGSAKASFLSKLAARAAAEASTAQKDHSFQLVGVGARPADMVSPEEEHTGVGLSLEHETINARRAKVGLPPVTDPNAPIEVEKRRRGRRGALPLVAQIRFAIPREELEEILSEYAGPYGKIAEMDEDIPFPDCPHLKYEAYANGLPQPEEFDLRAGAGPLQLVKVNGKRMKGKRVLTKQEWVEEQRRADPDYETSDSEAEEALQAAIIEGKHHPYCWRPGWVIEKFTLTPAEAKRREREEVEVYELGLRLRELLDEFAATDEGKLTIQTEVERRMEKAQADLDAQKEVVDDTDQNYVDVLEARQEVEKRAARYNAGGDYEEHGFASQHQVTKATRRAQDEVDEWTAFRFTEHERLERRKVRAAYAPETWRMNVVAGMEKVQNRKARLMVNEKNRRVAYKQGWRRLWDGRGGRAYDKWKEKKEEERVFSLQAALRKEDRVEGDDDSADEWSDDSYGDMEARAKKGGKVTVAAYDVVGTYSDPRKRRFSFGSSSGSDDERHKLEEEAANTGSESEYVPSTDEDDDDEEEDDYGSEEEDSD